MGLQEFSGGDVRSSTVKILMKVSAHKQTRVERWGGRMKAVGSRP